MTEKYAVKVEDGFVRIYRPDGTPERTLCGGSVSAEIKGEEILVTMQDGKVKAYSVRGFYKGTR
jgi:hypothetical protein